MNRKTLITAALMFILLLPGIMLLLPAATPGHAQESTVILVRFIHAYPTDSPFDVYVEGIQVVNGLAHAESTPYLRFAPGRIIVEVRPVGSNPLSPAFFERSVDLANNNAGFGHVTLVLQADSFNQPTIGWIEDILNPTAPGQARLQMLHVVPALDPVDLLLNSGAPFLQNVEFNAPINTIDPPVGIYDFVIAPAGSTGGAALSTLETTAFRTGTLYTMVLMPAIGNLGTELHLYSAALLPDVGAKMLRVQFGHGSPNAPAFDVYADDRLILPALQPGEILPHLPFPSGEVTLSVREAGSPATITPAAEKTVNLISPSGALTVVIMGSLEDGSFQFATLPDDITTLDGATARVQVINASSNGPANLQLSDGTVIANALPVNSVADPVDVPVRSYSVEGMVDDAVVNGPLPVQLPEQPFIGGAWITILVSTDEEPRLSISTSPLLSGPTSLPGFVAAIETPTPETPVAPSPVPSLDATAPTQVVTPAAPSTLAALPNGPAVLAAVELDAGTNLQCREYPSSTARSLGLIPNSSQLLILAYAGPVDLINGEANAPVDAAAFTNPESATTFDQIWLQADWISTEFTTRCWFRADFVRLSFYTPAGETPLLDPSGFFSLLNLTPPPVDSVPANTAGGIIGAGQPVATTPPGSTPAAPPTTVLGSITETSELLESPAEGSSVVARIAMGATVQLLGRSADAAWVNARYEVIGEGIFIGWLPADQVRIATSGVTLNDLPVTG